ncbi:MAG: TetR/AcrR family transcriptional regulator [Acidaminococcaceae bacterium]|nr:TetR/AcrR family transcriptional regulator [Acidaminococcaceae bacterium]
MDFRRANGEEQKRLRVQQIIDATAALYEEIGYDKVTFSKIARHVNFTRNLLYHYSSCKEDIFLLLLLQDIEKYVTDAAWTFTEPVTDVDGFCREWTALWLRHQRMASLFSIVNTVILKDATEKMHIKFRGDMHELFLRLRKVAKLLFPSFDEEKIYKFVEYQHMFALARYPASLEYKQLQHIPVYLKVGHGTNPFADEFIPYIKLILQALMERV